MRLQIQREDSVYDDFAWSTYSIYRDGCGRGVRTVYET